MLTENLIVLKGKGVDISKIDFKDYLFDCDRDNIYKWMKYATDDSLGDADKVLKDNEVLVKLGWGGTKYIDCIFSLKSLFNRFRAYFTTGTPYRDFSLKEAFDNYDKIFCEEEKERFCKANEIDKKFFVDLFAELNRFAKNTNTMEIICLVLTMSIMLSKVGQQINTLAINIFKIGLKNYITI